MHWVTVYTAGSQNNRHLLNLPFSGGQIRGKGRTNKGQREGRDINNSTLVRLWEPQASSQVPKYLGNIFFLFFSSFVAVRVAFLCVPSQLSPLRNTSKHKKVTDLGASAPPCFASLSTARSTSLCSFFYCDLTSMAPTK